MIVKEGLKGQPREENPFEALHQINKSVFSVLNFCFDPLVVVFKDFKCFACFYEITFLLLQFSILSSVNIEY